MYCQIKKTDFSLLLISADNGGTLLLRRVTILLIVSTGSEYDSDENVDIDEKDDFMEEEAGDVDDVGTEEDLRNQVHRVHL
jgi:hypothetical protein